MSAHPSTDVARMQQALRREAETARRAEPFLAPLLDRTILHAESLHDSLARVLGEALACSDADEVACRRLLVEAMEVAPHIAGAAACDLRKVRADDPACRTHLHAFLNYKGFHALQAHRAAHVLWRTGRREAAAWLSNRASRVFGPDIHPAASLRAGILLDHGSGIVIGETAVVEGDATIFQNVTLGGTGKDRGDRHPKLRRGVTIGTGASVLGNVEIGRGSKVGAGSVVLRDVPPGCTVAGVPARIVRVHGMALRDGATLVVPAERRVPP